MRPTLREALTALTLSDKSAPVINDNLPSKERLPTQNLRDAIGDASGAINALDEVLLQLKESLEQLNALTEGEAR